MTRKRNQGWEMISAASLLSRELVNILLTLRDCPCQALFLIRVAEILVLVITDIIFSIFVNHEYVPLEGHSTDQVLVKKKGSRVNFHRHEKDRSTLNFTVQLALSVDSQNSEALYLFAVFL